MPLPRTSPGNETQITSSKIWTQQFIFIHSLTHTLTHTHICIYIYVSIPPHAQDATRGLLFKQSLTGLNAEFSFSQTISRLKSSVCPTILPIAGRMIVGFIPLARVSVLCSKQIAMSSIYIYIYMYIYMLIV